MKVYELMTALEDMPAGAEVKLSIVITREELESGDSIEPDCFAHRLSISDIEDDQDGEVTIGVLAPRR